jgi:hypothetical protein
VSAVPASLPSPEPVRTSTPATITMAASRPPKRRQLVTFGALALLVAAAGGVIGFRSFGGPASAVAPAAGVDVSPRVAAPAVTPQQATEALPPASAAAEDEANEALVIDAPASKRSQARRAAKARPVRPPPPVATSAPSAAPKRRVAVDDSEPDVGY